jgi:hypothetical protein
VVVADLGDDQDALADVVAADDHARIMCMS